MGKSPCDVSVHMVLGGVGGIAGMFVSCCSNNLDGMDDIWNVIICVTKTGDL